MSHEAGQCRTCEHVGQLLNGLCGDCNKNLQQRLEAIDDERLAHLDRKLHEGLLQAAIAVIEQTDTCKRGVWQVPHTPMKNLVLAIEACGGQIHASEDSGEGDDS